MEYVFEILEETEFSKICNRSYRTRLKFSNIFSNFSNTGHNHAYVDINKLLYFFLTFTE